MHKFNPLDAYYYSLAGLVGTYSLLGALLSLWEPHWQAILLIAALTIGIAALCSVAYHKATISIGQNALLLAIFIMLILTIIASQQIGYSAIIIGLALCIVGVNLKSWLQMNTRAH
ncbi:hypothetical protein [Latilactobacillus sakei]|uniref:hypothetical protein n=1 Tax=Latilactobacillus sakei TaxID=1599 RepID=UPI001CFAB180|nr:hypothetical protein [Latilactobacillus sakei]MCB4409895.1 hypothetical protein [Latilactobacillus sakei]